MIKNLPNGGVHIVPDLETVPCMFCGEPATFSATALCDNCWEFERRIDTFISNKKGMAYVVKNIRQAKIKEWQDTWRQHPDYKILPDLSKIIESVNPDIDLEDWTIKMTDYASNSMYIKIIVDAISNKFLWLE